MGVIDRRRSEEYRRGYSIGFQVGIIVAGVVAMVFILLAYWSVP